MEAVRHKKSRLLKTAKTIAALHGGRARFGTFTCRANITLKKEFLYRLENIRKALARTGIVLKYSGMLERQRRGAWHFHCLCYTACHDWDYKAIQKAAVAAGFNFDFRKLGKARRTSRKLAGYMAKLEAVCAAAYAAKMRSGGKEDYCYTLTAKGCSLPVRKRMRDPRAAWEFIQGKGFRKKEHRGFAYYLSESERFSLAFYRSIRAGADTS
ncbi:MAG: hypothetical protein LBH25_04705 [Fibromonadaceae bacterium]|nr:hypothetical protein [Fibromonadaceae bacterium]